MVDDEDASSDALLVVLLETHPAAWRAIAGGAGNDVKTTSTTTSTSSSSQGSNISPPALIAAVAAFVGAYELEAEDNGVVVLAVHGGKCPVLYRSPWLRDEGDEERQEEQQGPLTPIAERLASAVAHLIEADIDEGKKDEGKTHSPSPALSAALSRALCLCAAADRPTTGEAEILSAEPSEGAEPHGGSGADGGAAAAGSSSSSAVAAAAAGGTPTERARPHPRIVVLAATPAAGESYIPLMNCAFAAQRLCIAVDVCELVEGAATGLVEGEKKRKDARKKRSGAGGGGWATVDDDTIVSQQQQQRKLSPPTSTLLSQVAHLTGGLVVSPPSLLSSSTSSSFAAASASASASASAISTKTTASSSAASLLECLLSVFAPGVKVRRWLSLPREGAVDMRASCFCHKRPIDVGFVCSVCLSIFCETKAACSTCGADFGGGGGGDFSAGEKRPAAGAGAAAAEARPRLG